MAPRTALPPTPHSQPRRGRRGSAWQLLLAAVAAAAVAPTAWAGCYDYCGFSATNDTDGSVMYSWDLRGLCNNGSGYAFTNGGMQYRFEICGTIDPVVPPLPACVGNGVRGCW